jgi:hypothetical protein
MNSNPVYVYAPPFVTWSAGIRVLHQICDQLNRNGIPAWLALHGPTSQNEVSLELDTPLLNKEVLQSHIQSGFKAIAIYPETISGNPLNAAVTITWILNSPKLLGGIESFKSDFVYGFTEALTKEYEEARNLKATGTIFLPPLNVEEVAKVVRKEDKTEPFKLLYCQKFRVLGGTPDSFEGKVIEIERFTPAAPSRTELLELISRSEEVIVYENSTIITEAEIIGTPVRCIKNEGFMSLLAEKELGSEGVVWGREVTKADTTRSREKTLNLINEANKKFPQILSVENIKWQSAANLKTVKRTRVPKRSLITRHSLMRLSLVLKSHGIPGAARFGLRYVYRWIHEKL